MSWEMSTILFSASKVVLSGMSAEARRVMAAYWSRKQEIRVGIENAGVTFVDPNSWVHDWVLW